MKNMKGSSLIELIVVIAIVGILAAIAAPKYKSYVINSRFQNVAALLENYVQIQQLYATKNGYFGSATQLGLDTTQTGYGSQQINDPYLISPYFIGVGFNGNLFTDMSAGPIACGQYGLVQFDLDPQALGFDSDVTAMNAGCVIWNQAMNAGCVIWNQNGVFDHACFYEPSGPGGNILEDLFNIPNWYNSYVTWPPAAIADDYNSATCM